MDKVIVTKQLLVHLYNAFFLSEDNFNLRDFAENEGWLQERTAFWNLVNELTDRDRLIESAGLGGVYKITPVGVRHVEGQGLASPDLISTNRSARMRMLLNLAQVYDEHGELYSHRNSNLYTEAGLDQTQGTANLLVLHGLGFAEPFGNGGSKITSRGYYEVERERRYRSIVDEFERISALQPQPRGRALQKLIAKVVEIYGWQQQEGVKTSNEEMDVIVFRDREYYLLESKWEKDRVEASVIRELIGKLENRAGVRGIVASMSGFSDGAGAQVRDHSGKREILLFGPGDLRALILGESSFDDLLNAKYNSLVTKRIVDWS